MRGCGGAERVLTAEPGRIPGPFGRKRPKMGGQLASAPGPARVGVITQVKTALRGDLTVDSNTSLALLVAV